VLRIIIARGKRHRAIVFAGALFLALWDFFCVLYVFSVLHFYERLESKRATHQTANQKRRKSSFFKDGVGHHSERSSGPQVPRRMEGSI
jgi:hypothetical protein